MASAPATGSTSVLSLRSEPLTIGWAKVQTPLDRAMMSGLERNEPTSEKLEIWKSAPAWPPVWVVPLPRYIAHTGSVPVWPQIGLVTPLPVVMTSPNTVLIVSPWQVTLPATPTAPPNVALAAEKAALEDKLPLKFAVVPSNVPVSVPPASGK